MGEAPDSSCFSMCGEQIFPFDEILNINIVKTWKKINFI